MYLIVEGMPSSGKTTLAKALANRYDANYFKSLLPNDAFGNQVRKIRDNSPNIVETDLFHIIDLFRNEIQILELLKSGKSVVRDKCFISSLAHCLSECIDADYEIQRTIKMAYDELRSIMVRPDALILVDRNLEDSRNMCKKKQDTSALDESILGNPVRFLLQKDNLITLAKQHFGDCLILLSNNESLEEEIEIINRRI